MRKIPVGICWSGFFYVWGIAGGKCVVAEVMNPYSVSSSRIYHITTVCLIYGEPVGSSINNTSLRDDIYFIRKVMIIFNKPAH